MQDDSRSITGANVCGRCMDSEDGVINSGSAGAAAKSDKDVEGLQEQQNGHKNIQHRLADAGRSHDQQ